MSSEPSKTTGQYHSVKGTVVETVRECFGLAASKIAHAALCRSETLLVPPHGPTRASRSTLQAKLNTKPLRLKVKPTLYATYRARWLTLISAVGYVEGTMDRVEGKKDSVVGAITGDQAQQTSGERLLYLPCPYKSRY